MTNQEFQEKMNTIQEKIGEDAKNLILDDIGILLTDNQNMNKTLDDKDKEIEKLKKTKDKEIERLKKTNETLQSVNGNLLQQISMGEDQQIKENEDNKEKTPFDFRTVFDEKRKF